MKSVLVHATESAGERKVQCSGAGDGGVVAEVKILVMFMSFDLMVGWSDHGRRCYRVEALAAVGAGAEEAEKLWCQ